MNGFRASTGDVDPNGDLVDRGGPLFDGESGPLLDRLRLAIRPCPLEGEHSVEIDVEEQLSLTLLLLRSARNARG